jgi:hypothetical protein
MPGNPGTSHGAALHRELELLVKAGLTPTEALAAATSVPAKTFRLGDRGRIAKGMRADLVLVNGDPSVDITATRAIDGVWKQGVRADRDGFAKAIVAANTAVGREPPGATSGVVSDFESGTTATTFGAGWSVHDGRAGERQVGIRHEGREQRRQRQRKVARDHRHHLARASVRVGRRHVLARPADDDAGESVFEAGSNVLGQG